MSQQQQLFLDFARQYLVAKDAKCYRHCGNQAKFTPIFKSESSLIGAYVCPDRYISRVVYFSERPDENWFYSFLSDQLGQEWVKRRDIRRATRHGWELGGNAEDEIKKVSKSGIVKQYYWTFYPKSEEDKARGAFVCSNCGKLYLKAKSGPGTPCPHCGNS